MHDVSSVAARAGHGGPRRGTLEAGEDPAVSGSPVAGSVWYTFRTSQARRVVLRFVAGGELDAGVQVYRRARSQLPLEQSLLSGEDGRVEFIFDSRAGATYFVRVAQRANSAPPRSIKKRRVGNSVSSAFPYGSRNR